MKKLFLLAVLSAVVCGAAAHPNHIFGVRVGMNIANMTFKAGGVSATPNSVVRPLVAFSYEKSLMHTLPLYFENGAGYRRLRHLGQRRCGEAQRLLFRGAGTGQLAFRFDGRRLVDSLSGSEYARRLRRQGEVPDRQRPIRSATGDSTVSIWASAPASGWSTVVIRSVSVTMRDSSISPMCRTSRFATRRSSCNWATASIVARSQFIAFPCRCGGGRSF